jgi:hypothetical protein
MTYERLNTIGTLVAAAKECDEGRIKINRSVVEELIQAVRDEKEIKKNPDNGDDLDDMCGEAYNDGPYGVLYCNLEKDHVGDCRDEEMEALVEISNREEQFKNGFCSLCAFYEGCGDPNCTYRGPNV